MSTDLSNKLSMEDFLLLIAADGAAAGKGKDAILDTSRRCIEHAIAGTIGSDHAKIIYQTYEENEAKARKSEGDSLKSQVQKIRSFIRLGLAGKDAALELYDRALAYFNAKDVKGKGSTHRAMLRLAAKANSTLKEKGDERLPNDAEIEEALFPTKEEKDEIARLTTLLEMQTKLHDGAKDTGEGAMPSYELKQSIELIKTRIDTLMQYAIDLDDARKLGMTVEEYREMRFARQAPRLTHTPASLAA